MAALIAAFVVSLAMLLALQAYYHATTALAHAANRARALMVLESQAETMRAAGFAMLPEPGRHALPSEALRGLPGSTGTLLVRPGAVAGMRMVTLEMQWSERSGPGGQMRVVFAMSSRGMDP
jgi:hypothetical protein